jgi:hypothetical protein
VATDKPRVDRLAVAMSVQGTLEDMPGTVPQHGTEPSRLLAEAEAELRRLDERRAELVARIARCRQDAQPAQSIVAEDGSSCATPAPVTMQSPEADKVRLFRSLFRGREDVYPKRFESARTGKSGYQPDCTNEWVAGVCQKPRVRCRDCANRLLLPVTDDRTGAVELGHDPRGGGRGVGPNQTASASVSKADDCQMLTRAPVQGSPRSLPPDGVCSTGRSESDPERNKKAQPIAPRDRDSAAASSRQESTAFPEDEPGDWGG